MENPVQGKMPGYLWMRLKWNKSPSAPKVELRQGLKIGGGMLSMCELLMSKERPPKPRHEGLKGNFKILKKLAGRYLNLL